MIKPKKPATGQVAGFRVNIEALASKIDTPEDSPNTLHLQAARIRDRFAISWPVARLIAELHHGAGAAA